jgi:hypothetical protein
MKPDAAEMLKLIYDETAGALNTIEKLYEKLLTETENSESAALKEKCELLRKKLKSLNKSIKEIINVLAESDTINKKD